MLNFPCPSGKEKQFLKRQAIFFLLLWKDFHSPLTLSSCLLACMHGTLLDCCKFFTRPPLFSVNQGSVNNYIHSRTPQRFSANPWLYLFCCLLPLIFFNLFSIFVWRPSHFPLRNLIHLHNPQQGTTWVYLEVWLHLSNSANLSLVLFLSFLCLFRFAVIKSF